MTTTKAPGDGLPAQLPDENFHDYMSRLYREQGYGGRDRSPYVQARLPGPLYAQFWAFLKEQGWGHSTGIQYAITQLLNKDKC